MKGIEGSLIGRRAQALAEGPEDAGMTRREAVATTLINMASTSLVTGVVFERAYHARTGTAAAGDVVPFSRVASHEAPDAYPREEALAASERDHAVPRELIGKRLAGLERRYVGAAASAGALAESLPPIDFSENLQSMLAEKQGIVADARTGAVQQRVYDALARSYAARTAEGSIRKTDLAGFRSLIEQETHTMLDALGGRYEEIARTYFRNALGHADVPERERARVERGLAAALEYLAKHITPDVQLAYIATEIMPAPDRGAALLSFLLENAGVEFLERIPALGDKELSYGPFQLTPYAVGSEGSASKLLRVANVRRAIPEDLASFSRIEDHLRAGFAFGLYNLTALLQDLVKRGQFEEVAALCDSASAGSAAGRSTVFLEYLASAHHRPVVAREVMQSWLRKNTRLPKGQRTTSLTGYFDDSPANVQVKTYAEKSRQHFLHIQRFFAARRKRT